MINADVAIWLYGSAARGDWDEHSDCDVLVIDSPREEPGAKELLQSAWNWVVVPSISRYEWKQVDGMAVYGSLFLHHLKAEGRVLWEGALVRGRLAKKLDELPSYKRIGQDLFTYRQAVSDVRCSLSDDCSVPFELAVLATTLRHAAVLGCYVMDHPDFGRRSAIDRYTTRAALECWTPAKIQHLLDYKLWSDGRKALPSHLALEQSADKICEEVELLIKSVEGEARWRGLIAA